MKADPRHPTLAGLDDTIRECREHGRPLTLVHLDIDGFRRDQVRHGALAACNRLRGLQRSIADLMQAGDLCTPFGEHRALVALPDRDVQHGLEFVERARLRLAQHGLDGSVSIAVVQVGPAGSAGSAEAIGAARRLVFESKNFGGGLTLCTTLAACALLPWVPARATLN
jgi:GGDEF domain-containing protein